MPHQDAATSSLVTMLTALRQLPGCAGLARVAVALYDPHTDMLHSRAVTDALLERYQIPLDEVPSLAILATGDEPRVVDDLAIYGHRGSPHTAALREAGYRSSLTFPVNRGDTLVGFVFFNAETPRFFLPAVVSVLTPHVPAIVILALSGDGLTPA